MPQPPGAAPSFVDRAEPDHATLWAYLLRLIDRLAAALDRHSFLDDSLDSLVELFGADRGLVVLREGGGSHVVNARGQGRSLSPEEREEVSRTLIRKVERSGKFVVFEAWRDRDASESIASLGISAALASIPAERLSGLPPGRVTAPATDLRLTLKLTRVVPTLTFLRAERFRVVVLWTATT